MAAYPPELPITQHAAAILSKVEGNRVTLLIGATGCGKSTQMPKILREHLQMSVLCVQPRRMAVVAVAQRVAEELNVHLGGKDVGYHIGGACTAQLERTELLFVTAGIFLEQLKCHGAAALKHYGAVILDEVHERSCENDLALACLMQLILSSKALKNLKLILMSATADVRRYAHFMRPICGDDGAPALYALGESSKIYNITQRFLTHAIAEAGYATAPSTEAFARHDRASMDRQCELIEVLTPKLIQKTVKEDGLGRSVLVFCPTYSMIEQLHGMLHLALPGIPIYVLHSSIDMDESMAALLGEDGAPARVILATNVAESSITINKVTHVIDTCRSCEIHWSPESGDSTPHVVWTSTAQATQRMGRTGRMNDGTVWRLVEASWFHTFPAFETASMQLQLLRKEALLLTCASSPRLNATRSVLASSLDPPDGQVVHMAEHYLVNCSLLTPNARRKSNAPTTHAPTPLGRLVDALPVDLQLGQLVLYGALSGVLNEAVLLAAIRTTQPMVLKREPNEPRKYEALVARYGPASASLHCPTRADSFAEDELLANLAAYLSFARWQADVQQLRGARQHVTDSGGGMLTGTRLQLHGLKRRPELNGETVLIGEYDQAAATYSVTLNSGERLPVSRAHLRESEAAWCRARHLSHTAILAVARTAEHILNTFYRASPPLCKLNLDQRTPLPAPTEAEDDGGGDGALFSLVMLPDTESRLRTLLQTLRPPKGGGAALTSIGSHDLHKPCFFAHRDCCNHTACPFGHSGLNKGPLCKFAAKGKCRFGTRCKHRHPRSTAVFGKSIQVDTLQEQVQRGFSERMGLFVSAEKVGTNFSGELPNCLPPVDYLVFDSVLLLGEGDFSFAASLVALLNKPRARAASREGGAEHPSSPLQASAIIATALLTEEEAIAAHPRRGRESILAVRNAGACVLFRVDARALDTAFWATLPRAHRRPHCIVWNMPFDGVEQSWPNELLMRGFFAAVLRSADVWLFSLPEKDTSPFQVHLTMGMNQFSDWNLLCVADHYFLELLGIHAFDASLYEEYSPVRARSDVPFDVGEVRTYVFLFNLKRLKAAAAGNDTSRMGLRG